MIPFRSFFSFLLMVVLLIAGFAGCNQNPQTPVGGNDSLPAALQRLNAAIIEDPGNAALYVDRARWNADHNLPDSALSDVRRALSLDSLNPSIYIALSDIYQLTGKFPEAEKAILKARSINPDHNEAIVAHARFYLIFKNYDEAIKLADEAIKKKPSNPKAYFVAGITFLEKGDTLAAIKNLMQATNYDNQYFDAWIRLALLYDGKQNDLAEGYFKNALRIQPESQAAWYLLGFFYQENGVYNKAIAAYDTVLKLNPRFRDALYNKGFIAMIIEEDYPKAISLFTQALEVSPEYADALYNRGYARELSGDSEKAILDYQAVLKLVPEHPKALEAIRRLQ